jgi:GMP synthase (glutamine-hydrolysing)
MAKPVLILQTGNSPDDIRPLLGDFSQWFIHAIGLRKTDVHIVHAHKNEQLLCPSNYCATIISGSHSMVTDHAPWSEKTAGWIRNAMDKDHPLFGTCYGHQLISYALGGIVDYHPQGREIGTCEINLLSHQNDPLANRLPQQFLAQLTHLQTVLEKPKNALVLAKSSHDPHQIMRYSQNAFSTQFHPEFTTTIMSAYVTRNIPQLTKEGFNIDRLLNNIRTTPQANHILRDFIIKHRTLHQ